MTILYVLLVAHFVGDFLCQSDWMAGNKSKRLDALAWHVAVYIAAVSVIVAAFQPPSPYQYVELRGFGLFVLMNAGAHFLQAASTRRLTARLWFIDGIRVKNEMWSTPIREHYGANAYEVAYNDKRHWFFVGIGADQLLHYVTLFITAGWWLQ